MAKPSIRPQVWRPPRAPAMDGAYAPNRLLAGLERLEVPGSGPEDVVVDHAGDVYTGTADGTILRLSADGRRIERVATTGGRPLGIEVAPDGRLVVCDAERGLLRLDPRTEVVETLLDAAAGVRLANNAAIGSDGSIYFSDSSQLFPLAHFKADLLEHSGTGRLLRRHPDGEVEPLLTGLQFANGVALAPDESFVLVAETGGYRVRRYWLSGPRSGTDDVLVDNLPGLPDNLSTGPSGVFWVAMPSTRNATLDWLLPRPGVLRRAVWALPDAIQPDAARVTFVLGLAADGTVVHNLQDDGQRYHYVTGVREHDGWLYLGSLVESAVARVRLPGAGA